MRFCVSERAREKPKLYQAARPSVCSIQLLNTSPANETVFPAVAANPRTNKIYISGLRV